jgi:hypothetical protein
MLNFELRKVNKSIYANYFVTENNYPLISSVRVSIKVRRVEGFRYPDRSMTVLGLVSRVHPSSHIYVAIYVLYIHIHSKLTSDFSLFVAWLPACLPACLPA